MEYYHKIGAEWAWRQGFPGRGVGIALLDTGCFPHPDLEGRITAFQDFVRPRSASFAYDDNGHGTHIAGILAGNGRMSGGRYRGMAPESHLVVLKILDRQGNGSIANLDRALMWLSRHARQYGVRIVNISVGGAEKERGEENERLIEGVERLWDQGMVVVAAAGNNGPGKGSVTIPGVSRKIITVGCSEIRYFSGSRSRGTTPLYSGRGPTRDCVVKPEVLAPGSEILSCCPPDSRRRYWYAAKSGTSMATPVVSGAVALLLEKRPEYTNVDVKLKLRESCRPVEGGGGWGEIQVDRLLE